MDRSNKYTTLLTVRYVHILEAILWFNKENNTCYIGYSKYARINKYIPKIHKTIPVIVFPLLAWIGTCMLSAILANMAIVPMARIVVPITNKYLANVKSFLLQIYLLFQLRNIVVLL